MSAVQVHERGDRRREKQLTVDLSTTALLGALLGDLDRVSNDLITLLFQPRTDVNGPRGSRPGLRGGRTCTTVRAALRIRASRAAQETAVFEAGDPSTPTIMPGCVMGPDISRSFMADRLGVG